MIPFGIVRSAAEEDEQYAERFARRCWLLFKRHVFDGDPNDPEQCLSCLRCGMLKKLNFVARYPA